MEWDIGDCCVHLFGTGGMAVKHGQISIVTLYGHGGTNSNR